MSEEDVIESMVALNRAGWVIGDIVFVNRSDEWLWIVSGHNGENLIRTTGVTQDEAWRRAVEQAREVGMFGRTDQQGRPDRE
jgi:hypothetical protein